MRPNVARITPNQTVNDRRSKSRTQKERKSPIKKTLNPQSFKLQKNPTNYSRSQISNSTAVGTVKNATANTRSVRSKKKERDDDGNTEPDIFEREAESELNVKRSDLTGLTDIIVRDSMKLDKQMESIIKDKKSIRTPKVQELKSQSLTHKSNVKNARNQTKQNTMVRPIEPTLDSKDFTYTTSLIPTRNGSLNARNAKREKSEYKKKIDNKYDQLLK